METFSTYRVQMSPEAQREAIAKACGYEECGCGWWQIGNRASTQTPTLPNYLRDLNAMAEAEATLTEPQLLDYFRQLEKVLDAHHGAIVAFAVGRATAAQRAEAFLKAKGLWTE